MCFLTKHLTLQVVTTQLEVCVWVKCQGWWSFLFPVFMHFLFGPSQVHVRTILNLNYIFPQIEVNPRILLHFLTSDSGKLSIFCIHKMEKFKEMPSLFCCCSGSANHRLRQTLTLDMAICVSRKLIINIFCTEVFLMKQNGKHL